MSAYLFGWKESKRRQDGKENGDNKRGQIHKPMFRLGWIGNFF